ncbi:hypothetical protein [Aeromonas media]|uniref:hypothetical protein n=1 Tax=Aeromonas media TaxID=651 RepID=UPI00148B163D|nr:hypothetical protein [Aeromonas media]
MKLTAQGGGVHHITTGVSYEGMSTPEREAKIQARKEEEEEIRKEFRRVAVVAVYGSV